MPASELQQQSAVRERTISPGKSVRGFHALRDNLLVAVLLVFLSVASYGGCLDVTFSSDDFDHIGTIYSGLHGHSEIIWKNLTGCFLDWPLYGLHFRPLLQLAYMFDLVCWNVAPAGWHITNLALHSCASFLLFLFARKFSAVLRNAADDTSEFESADCLPDSITQSASQACARHHELDCLVSPDGKRSEPLQGVVHTTMKSSDSSAIAVTNQNATVAFIAAALFAVNPLHAEVVNWIVARVDSLCGIFVLAGLYCTMSLIEQKTKSNCAPVNKFADYSVNATECSSRASAGPDWQLLSCLFFVLGLCMKESAATFPLITLILCRAKSRNFRSAVRLSSPYWLILLGYIGLRAAALHAMVGGYLASTGHISLSMLKPFISFAFLKYIFLPVPSESLPQVFPLELVLAGGYAMLLVSFWTTPRGEKGTARIRTLNLLCAWFCVSLAPIVPIFTPLPNQIANHLLYLPAIPLCLMLGLLVQLTGSAPRRFCSTLSLVVILVSYIYMSRLNTQLWCDATKLGFAISQRLNEVLSNTTSDKVVLSSWPRSEQGVHIHYFVSSLQRSISPPFLSPGCSSVNKLQLLEPHWMMESGLTNLSALRRAAASSGSAFLRLDRGIYPEQPPVSPVIMHPVLGTPKPPIAIDASDKAHLSVRVENGIQHITVQLEHAINPLDYPILLIGARGWAGRGPAYVYVKDPKMNYLSVAASHVVHPLAISGDTMFVHLGELECWVDRPAVDLLCLSLPLKDGHAVDVQNVILSADTHLVPRLEPSSSLILKADGTYSAAGAYTADSELSNTSGPSPASGAQSTFEFDASGIVGAHSIEAEISGPFANLGPYRDMQRSSVAIHRLKVDSTRGSIAIPPALRASFRPGCWYSVRILCCDRSGKIIGFSSDPVHFVAGGKQ